MKFAPSRERRHIAEPVRKPSHQPLFVALPDWRVLVLQDQDDVSDEGGVVSIETGVVPPGTHLVGQPEQPSPH